MCFEHPTTTIISINFHRTKGIWFGSDIFSEQSQLEFAINRANTANEAKSNTEAHQFNELYGNPISIKSIYGRCAFFHPVHCSLHVKTSQSNSSTRSLAAGLAEHGSVSVCVCVCEMWVAIGMRISLCFSSINKTAAINLNIGRRFHAKLCLVLASLQPLCVCVYECAHAHALPPMKWNSKFEFIGLKWNNSNEAINVFDKYHQRIHCQW